MTTQKIHTAPDSANESPYTREFYNTIGAGSRNSAKVVAPIALQLAHPRSIVDVGCGDGTWLAEFRALGVSDIVGLDGEYVDRQSLKIPQDQFSPTDLSLPFERDRIFDLAVSLEVAEHLPTGSAEGFVDSLTRLAPMVLFSAAVPFQAGTRHLNEQWPEYWARLFNRRGFVLIDCIRPKIWDNDQVAWWYRQNCFVYVEKTLVGTNAVLRGAYEATNPHQLSMVHPRLYMHAIQPRQLGVRSASAMLTKALWNAAFRHKSAAV